MLYYPSRGCLAQQRRQLVAGVLLSLRLRAAVIIIIVARVSLRRRTRRSHDGDRAKPAEGYILERFGQDSVARWVAVKPRVLQSALRSLILPCSQKRLLSILYTFELL